ncbi:MAG: PAS domain S-box protein [Mariniphaga sp.]
MSLIEGNSEIEVDLRLLAEGSLKSKFTSMPVNPSEADWQRLVLELKVHQIELEMQNEELVKAKETAEIAVKKAEIAIEKYTELYDFAPSGYFTLSKEGIILDINFRAARILNKKRSLLINCTLGFFVSNDTKHIYNNFLINTFDSNNAQSCEVTFQIEDRLPMYIQLSGIVVENKEQCLVNLVDITDHRQVEQLLKQTCQNYEAFFNSTDDLFFVLDKYGNMVHTNTAVNEQLGYSTKELIGKSIHMLHPRDRINEASTIIRALLNGIPAVCYIPFITKLGVEIPVETRVSIGKWDGVTAIFWVTKDISHK